MIKGTRKLFTQQLHFRKNKPFLFYSQIPIGAVQIAPLGVENVLL